MKKCCDGGGIAISQYRFIVYNYHIHGSHYCIFYWSARTGDGWQTRLKHVNETPYSTETRLQDHSALERLNWLLSAVVLQSGLFE